MEPDAASLEEARQAPFMRVPPREGDLPDVYENTKFEALKSSSAQVGTSLLYLIAGPHCRTSLLYLTAVPRCCYNR